MKLTIIRPHNAHCAYKIAAETFAELAAKVSGCETQIITDADAITGLPEDIANVVIIGSDAVNHFTSELYFAKKIGGFNLRYCTDDYTIRTFCDGEKSFLLLAGGRPRAVLYAVYRYFELNCGCRYFWDGDRIPQADLPFSGIEENESPRFEYRGIRYFAHRSLHRFQAEHWSLDDWKREIDWILKKRLNMFMLRIGLDDIFQKSFPDIVSYPDADSKLPEARQGYDDRTLFWPLQYRGELRRQLLCYAFERDLMHPEDCGTMTHWYSRTPLEFLKGMNPKILDQKGGPYNDLTGKVWDIRDDKNLENYFKLTETHIREYGKPDLFHTIGLAERSFSEDRDENLRLKLYVYRRISSYLSEKYPNAPLLIASWDLWMFYTPEEVRTLVSQLDPSQSIILDYTSDTTRESNFTNWGVVGKFPWIFGIFSGYEPNSEIRGYYEFTNERLKIAKNDSFCKGLVLWPELSHGDSLIIEYLAQNAWEKDTPPVSKVIEKLCADRYSIEYSDKMLDIWREFIPIVETRAWSMDKTFAQSGNDIFPMVIQRTNFAPEYTVKNDGSLMQAEDLRGAAISVLRGLSELDTASLIGESECEFLRRDICDIARTVLGRYVDYAILLSQKLYALRGNPAVSEGLIFNTLDLTVALNEALCGVLSSHEDYSLYDSLKRLNSITKTNSGFEETLKNNAENGYCRAYIYENARYLYVPEMKLLFGAVRKAIESGGEIDRSALKEAYESNRSDYFALPLSQMDKAKRMDISTALKLGAQTLEKLQFLV